MSNTRSRQPRKWPRSKLEWLTVFPFSTHSDRFRGANEFRSKRLPFFVSDAFTFLPTVGLGLRVRPIVRHSIVVAHRVSAGGAQSRKGFEVFEESPNVLIKPVRCVRSVCAAGRKQCGR